MKIDNLVDDNGVSFMTLPDTAQGKKGGVTVTRVGRIKTKESCILDPMGTNPSACRSYSLDEIRKLGVRVVMCRAGIVLGKGNVATQIFTLVSKLNLSGPIGKGEQYFSWVSVDDLVSAYIFCLNNSDISGPVNCTAPEPLQQKEFARIIAKTMNKKYFAPPLPPIIMRVAVGWELGEQLGLNSIRAIPKKLLEKGFVFKNTTLDTMKEDFINE